MIRRRKVYEMVGSRNTSKIQSSKGIGELKAIEILLTSNVTS